MTDLHVFRHLGLIEVSDEERAALEALKAQYPEAVFERAADGTVRVTGEAWPWPLRAGTAAELAVALAQRST